MKDESRRPDVVIVGAGMVGTALAVRLAEAGLAVTVVDRAVPGAGASGGNMGLVLWSDAEPLAGSLDLTREAWRDLPEELAELGDVEYRPIHTLTLIPEGRDSEGILESCAHLSRAGFESSLIGLEEIHRLEPALELGGSSRTGAIGGALYQEQAALNPILFTLAWERRARRAGARFIRDRRVTGLRLSGGRGDGASAGGPEAGHRRVVALETESGPIEGGLFILAAGAWTRELALKAGLDLPQYHIIGEALVTETVPPIVRGLVGLAQEPGHDRVSFELAVSATQRGAGEDTQRAAVLASQYTAEAGLRHVDFAVVQEPTGGLVVGQISRGDPELGENVTPGSLRDMAAGLTRFFPALSRTAIIRAWAKPVPFTPDHQPIIGFAGGVEGLFICSGLKSTIIITPLLSKLVAEAIISGRLGRLSFCSPDRFARG